MVLTYDERVEQKVNGWLNGTYRSCKRDRKLIDDLRETARLELEKEYKLKEERLKLLEEYSKGDIKAELKKRQLKILEGYSTKELKARIRDLEG